MLKWENIVTSFDLLDKTSDPVYSFRGILAKESSWELV